MARVNRFGFLAIAMAFHIVYIYSIFDIYFVSPIVSGMQEFQVQRAEDVAAPAQRLFLFVGRASLHILSEQLLTMSNLKAMVFEQTKHFNPFPNPTQKPKQISYRDLSLPSSVLACLSMGLLVYRILECPRSRGQGMLR
jgi:hypothetical protein